MELGKGGPVHLEGDSGDNSCKAKATGNCSKFFLIVDCLEFAIGIDKLKSVRIGNKKLVCTFII